ncbi:hypothetical protein D1AOALGA4SA_10353 [Olavius algarvensis Delta 1 endosymbiont]|nr:hypothetical protein D1AOALGA4SA_10353 [Olavius algarvensis Delta 1 endosymbiont]
MKILDFGSRISDLRHSICFMNGQSDARRERFGQSKIRNQKSKIYISEATTIHGSPSQ